MIPLSTLQKLQTVIPNPLGHSLIQNNRAKRPLVLRPSTQAPLHARHRIVNQRLARLLSQRVLSGLLEDGREHVRAPAQRHQLEGLNGRARVPVHHLLADSLRPDPAVLVLEVVHANAGRERERCGHTLAAFVPCKERVDVYVLGAFGQMLVDPAENPDVTLVLADNVQADCEVLLSDCEG